MHEAAGFVRVSLNRERGPPPPWPRFDMPLSGVAHVALDHERYLAALLDDPGLLLSIFGVHFTPYLMAELHEQNGQLVMERSCQWKLPHWPAAFSSDYPLNLISSTDPVSGETALCTQRSRLHESSCRCASRRYRRLAESPPCDGAPLRAPASPSLAGHALRWFEPIKVHTAIDAAALRKLKPTVSIVFEELRRALIPSPVQNVA